MADDVEYYELCDQYLNWLYQTLKSAYVSGDFLGLGDPDIGREREWYRWAEEEYMSQAANIYKGAEDAIDAGQPLTQQPGYVTPLGSGVPTFLDYLRQTQQVFGAEEISPIAGMTDVLGNRQLYRDAEGNYYNIDGNPVDSATVTKIIAAYFDSPESEDMTPYQEAEINIALQKLAWEQQQYGNLSEYQKQQLAYGQQQLTWEQQQYQTLSAYQQAQLGLSQQQLTAETAARQAELELQQREWLANIMANPANWIEAAYGSMLAGGTGMEGWPTKWYAENLPYGATMPTWTPTAGAGGVTGGITGGVAGAGAVPFSAMEGAIPTVGAGGVPLSQDTQDLYGALFAAEENVVRLNQMGAPESVIVGAAAETELIRAQLYLSERADESAYFGIQPTAEPYSQVATQLQQVVANPGLYAYGDLNYILTGNVGPGMKYYANLAPEYAISPEYAQAAAPAETTWMPQEQQIPYPAYEPQSIWPGYEEEYIY